MPHATGTGADLVRRRAQLRAEHALLRQQLLVLRRSVKRPDVRPADRALLVLLAGRVRAWRAALLLIRPATLLRGHRAGFQARWRRRSHPGPPRPALPAATVALLRRLAAEHPRWGAERIRGALGTLGVRVAKRTMQTSLRCAGTPRPRGPAWSTFLHDHAATIWACDCLPVTDLACRPLCACFVIALGTRRVVQVGVTHHPTDARVARQRRAATPFDQCPRFLSRDNDRKYGAACAHVAAGSGIRILRTPHRAPRANAVCARFLRSVRRACLDQVLVRGERHLRRVLRVDVASCNRARPHQGLGQATPEPPAEETRSRTGRLVAVPVLGDLHHT